MQNATYRQLELIHIPRTGGTTIEDCTKDESSGEHRWGVLNPAIAGQHKGILSCYGQHIPPNLLDFYAGKETFCVVRDPYERLVSQFGFASAFFPKENDCSVDGMNKYLLTELQVLKTNPEKDDCHLLPQSAYVWGWDKATRSVSRASKNCKHVLRFEHLHSEFNKLMAEKGYPYRLGGKRNLNTKSPSNCSKLSADNLSKEVIELATEIYREDFELLGLKARQHPSGRATNWQAAATQAKKHAGNLSMSAGAGLQISKRPMSAEKGPVPVWVWWDYPSSPPFLVKACLASWRLHAASPRFELRLVNQSNVRRWLPDLPEEFSRIPYAAAVTDFIRAGLLAEHGGVYLDTDVLLVRDLGFFTQELQNADLVSYANQGQDCQKGTFSSNVMAGTKGNALSKAWYVEAKRQLTQRCKLPSSEDAKPAQKVCCYTPEGNKRDACHVNWAGLGEWIAHPVLQQILAKRGSSESHDQRSGNFRISCFSEDKHKGFAPPGAPKVYTNLVRSAHATSSDESNICKFEGEDLVCRQLRVSGFLTRGLYHLFSSNLPDALQVMTATNVQDSQLALAELIRRALPQPVISSL